MRSTAASLLLILFAFVIDALQWAVFWAFFILGMVAPTATGVIIGNQYCPSGSTAISAACQVIAGGIGFLINLIPGVAEVGGAIGTALGMAMGIVLGLMLGPVLCVLLLMAGKFRARYMLPAFMGEMVPFLSFVPAWTAATVMSVLHTTVEKKVKSSVKGAVRMVAPAAAAMGKYTPQRFAEQRGWKQPFSDIRPQESLVGAARREKQERAPLLSPRV